MESVKDLSVLNTVAEVQLIYKSKVKPSAIVPATPPVDIS